MKWGEDRLSKLKEGRDRAAADRQRLVERLKARPFQAAVEQVAPPPPLPEPKQPRRCERLDVDAAMAAAGRLRFLHLDPSLDVSVGPKETLNRPTQVLLRSFLVTLATGGSNVVLQWPFGQRDVSVLHPLAMLASLCSPAARTSGGHAWCDSVPDFRTLYFPWRGGGTGAGQRSTLVDRHEVIRRNSRHLTRQMVGQPETSEALGKLHETLGHLSRLSLRDASKPHLAHPTLAELYPVFADDGGPARPFQRPAGELFGRVRHGAALSQLRDYRPEICQPSSAPFALYGVSARSDLKGVLGNAVLGVGGRRPDIVVVDLGPPALTRLGHAWEETLENFLNEVSARFPELPVLAVTQDGYVHRRVERMISDTEGRSGDARLLPGSSVLVRLSHDLLANDPAIDVVSPIIVHVHSAAGAASEAIKTLSEAARGASDPAIGGLLLRGIGNLRRALSLPCGVGVAYDILSEVDGQEAANTFLERRSAGTMLAPLQRAINGGAGGAERARFVAADQAVRRAFETLDQDTPIGSLLLELARSLVRKSSRSVVVFDTDTELLLATRRLVGEGEVGVALQRRTQRRHIKLTTATALEVDLLAIEASRDRNSWKRLVLVAPTSDQLARLLARAWLPDELVVLCDRAFAIRTAAASKNLGSHPDLAGTDRIGGRLTALSAAAKAEAEGRAVGTVDLELEARPVVLAGEDVIDLTGDDDEGREIVSFGLQSGRTLRARPGSVIVRHRRDAEVNPFERSIARDIAEGASILVPDHAFVEEARRVLPVEVLARSWVTVYHNAVEAALPQVAGDTLAAKARTLITRMRALGARDMSQAAVVDWIKVAEHKLLPPARLRPHAPQRKREFDAFMSILGLSALADKVWVEGVEQLRNDRRQAGFLMARAFVSVLVDPHGAAAGLDLGTKAKITALRARALDHLDAVVSREVYDNREGHVA